MKMGAKKLQFLREKPVKNRNLGVRLRAEGLGWNS
jgi:hypothetical protein